MKMGMPQTRCVSTLSALSLLVSFSPFRVLFLIGSGVVGGDVLVPRVRHDRLEVGPEHVVLEGRLELVHHSDEFGVHFGLDLVHFGELHGVEEGRFHALRTQRDVDVLHEVRDGGIF